MEGQGEEETLVVSESAVYALLTYHYHGENRALRRWITQEVVPCLRHERVPPAACNPCLSFLQWPEVVGEFAALAERAVDSVTRSAAGVGAHQ